MVLKENYSNSVLDCVSSYYGTTDKPYAGPSFILPNGEFLNISKCKNHSDVEYYLASQNLSIYQDFNRRTGSPTLKSIGCIRVDTPKYYIQLPDDNLTAMQYYSLKDWIDYLMTCNVPFVEVIAPSVRPVRYMFDDPDIDAEYVKDRIRRFYITGNLYESHRKEYADEL